MVQSAALEKFRLNDQPIRPRVAVNKLAFTGDDESKDQVDLTKPEKQQPEKRGVSLVRIGEKLWEGMTSPIRNALDNPVTTGAAVVVGAVIHNLAKKYNYKKIGVISVGVTTGFAAFNTGKGVWDVATAKTPEKQEKGFYTIGQGLSYGLLAAAPAPKVASSSGLIKEGEKVGHLQALKLCLQENVNMAKQLPKVLTGKTTVKQWLTAGEASMATGAAVVGGTELEDGNLPDLSVPDNNGEQPENMQTLRDLEEAAREAGFDSLDKFRQALKTIAGEETGGFETIVKQQGNSTEKGESD